MKVGMTGNIVNAMSWYTSVLLAPDLVLYSDTADLLQLFYIGDHDLMDLMAKSKSWSSNSYVQ